MNAPHIVALQRYFESLTLESVSRLADYYAASASFKDPFNEVRGVAQIERVFRHMFANLHKPEFSIEDVWEKENGAVFLWEFRFRFRANDPSLQRFTGMSLLRFDEAKKIIQHRDYWDAAEELYEKFPLIGPALRWIKRRVNKNVIPFPNQKGREGEPQTVLKHGKAKPTK